MRGEIETKPGPFSSATTSGPQMGLWRGNSSSSPPVQRRKGSGRCSGVSDRAVDSLAMDALTFLLCPFLLGLLSGQEVTGQLMVALHFTHTHTLKAMAS